MTSIHALTTVIAFCVAGSAIAGGGPYPVDEAPIAGSGKTRAEVIAEYKEAQRLGLTTVGEGDVPQGTPQQEALIAAAGQRAAEQERLAATAKPRAAVPFDAPPQSNVAVSETRRRLMRM